MAKRIHHMGMTLSKDAHDKFHSGARELSTKQHQALMKRMGVTKEEDEEWHRTHMTLAEQRAAGMKQLDASVIGASFVEWCVKQGWLVRQGKQYLASKDGVRQLRNRFEIAV